MPLIFRLKKQIAESSGELVITLAKADGLLGLQSYQTPFFQRVGWNVLGLPANDTLLVILTKA